MPKKRQIPYLFARTKADGTLVWDWKASPRLRKLGWQDITYDCGEAEAITLALERNRQVRALDARAPADGLQAPPAAPRVVRLDDLVARFYASDDFNALKPATQREYRSRIGWLQLWAVDTGGRPVQVRHIDRQMVEDLREALISAGRHTAAPKLRVLRLLLSFAQRKGLISNNPASRIRIPEPVARMTRIEADAREAIAEAAIELGYPWVSLAVDLGLWLCQRQGDIRHFNRMAWREMTGIDAQDAAVLANPQGRVMGFRLCQQKTGTWVDAPVPPMLHGPIIAAMQAGSGGHVFPNPVDPMQPMPDWLMQRRFRECRDAAAAVAIIRDQPALAQAIDACQFRDLRRTGMIMHKDAGNHSRNITALSGHAVLGHKTILDTYMPGDTAGAARCVATTYRNWLAEQERQKLG